MSTHGLDFKVVDPKSIPAKTISPRKSRYMATVAEFMKSGAQAVSVEVDIASPTSVATSLRVQIRKAKLKSQVGVLVRGDHVFLVRVTS